MNYDNYDELILGRDSDFYRNLNERIDDIDDSFYVLAAVAGAINTHQTFYLDLSPKGGIVRKILAENDDSVPRYFLQFIVFHKLSEIATGFFDRFILQLWAYYSIYLFDLHHAVVSVSLGKILEISAQQFPYRNVFLGELIGTTQIIPVYSKFDFPSLIFETGDHLDAMEHRMDEEYKVYLRQLRNLGHRNRHMVITDTLRISRLSQKDYYPNEEYRYIYIPPEEFLSSYDHYRELYISDYDFGYDIACDSEGNMTVLHEPQGMEFTIRFIPNKDDRDLVSIIFHILDSVLSDVRGSHLVSVDNCFSFVFRTNTSNYFDRGMILRLSAAIASSCPALEKILSEDRLLLSEKNKREFSLFVQDTSFSSIEGQMPVF